MSYYIHNKYDASSVAQLEEMQSAGHTIIDYYGLLEQGDETYKNLDTSSMPCVVTSLKYATIDENNFAKNKYTPDTITELKFSASIVIKSIQTGIVNVSRVNEGTVDVTIKTVNTDKCMVRLEYGGTQYSYWTLKTALFSNKLQIISIPYTSSASVNYCPFICRYEIIEFM